MKAVGALVAGLIGLRGCVGGVPGDGHAKTEARATAPFTAVDADTSVDVVVTRGDTPSLVVTTSGAELHRHVDGLGVGGASQHRVRRHRSSVMTAGTVNRVVSALFSRDDGHEDRFP